MKDAPVMIELGIIIACVLISYRILKNHFKLGVVLFLIGVFVYWWLPGGIVVSSFSGLNVFLGDVLLVLSVGLFLVYFSELRKKHKIMVHLTTGILILLSLSLLRGVFTYGLEFSVNEARLCFYPISALLWSTYASCKLKPKFNDLRVLAIGVVVVLLAIEVWNIRQFGIGSASDIRLADGSLVNVRPLMHIQALSLLAASSILAIGAVLNSKNRILDFSMAGVALIGIVVSQQRSVLIAAGFSFVFLVFQKRTAVFGLAILGSLLSLIWLTSLTDSSFLPAELSRSLADSSSNLFTFVARSGSWSQYLESFYTWDAIDQLLGKPFGAGWGRYDGANGIWVEFNPHNWYVTLLLRVGILGLGLFMILYAQRVLSAVRLGPRGFGLVLVEIQHLVFQNFYPAPWQVTQVVDAKKSDEENEVDSPYQTVIADIHPTKSAVKV